MIDQVSIELLMPTGGRCLCCGGVENNRHNAYWCAYHEELVSSSHFSNCRMTRVYTSWGAENVILYAQMRRGRSGEAAKRLAAIKYEYCTDHVRASEEGEQKAKLFLERDLLSVDLMKLLKSQWTERTVPPEPGVLDA